MPDVDEVKRVAKEKLGVLSRGATGEYGMLARLLDDDEEIVAIALGKVAGTGSFTGRVIVATRRRLLLVGKGFLTRRERIEEIPLEAVRDARPVPPGTLELDLAEGTRRLTFVTPTPQLAALADAARGRASRFTELEELARRKLGRVMGFGVESALIALDQGLAPGEPVIDLAYADGLLAVCAERLVFVPAKGEPESLPYAGLSSVAPGVEGTLVLRSGPDERHFGPFLGDRAEILVQRIAPRLRPTG